MTSTGPRYLRIAAELRRRIADGRLAPGQRVPSTRQIALHWHVAPATAAKVLTTLQQEGLVRAQPRVGYVVAAAGPGVPASPRRAPSSADHELTRERIVRAAIEIADAEGLPALSMRAVASRLGVAAMSPYRHVESKDALILLMTDAAFAELGYPGVPPRGWRAQLQLGARTLWQLFRRHPWLAQLGSLSRPLFLPSLIAHGEWSLRALEGLGLDWATMLELHVVVYSYVQGLAAELEREAHAIASSGLSEAEYMAAQAPALAALVTSGRYPTFARVVGELGERGYDLKLDDVFERGLQALFEGFAVIIRRQGRRRASR